MTTSNCHRHIYEVMFVGSVNIRSRIDLKKLLQPTFAESKMGNY
ncbi:MAG: hypothetical protein SNH27_17085 [Rikenellaceae bacterium]